MGVSAALAAALPSRDCPLCPRLGAVPQHPARGASRLAQRPGAVRSAKIRAELLIVGLAPGLRGANRTGRPFTGDYAGDLLYATLLKFGLAGGSYAGHPDDGLTLRRVRITNAVRCVPPQNKPETGEIAACRQFLAAELAALPNVRAILALGAIAHRAVLSTGGLRQAAYPFAHAALHELPSGMLLADSYHCSRLNTNTGTLTPAMFEAVFATLVERLTPCPASA